MPKMIFTLFAVLVGLVSSMTAQSGTDISLAVSPTTITMPQGGAAQVTVTLGGSDKGKIDLSLSGLPDGVSAQIPAARHGDVTIVVAAGPTAKVGTYTIQVIARTADNYQTNTFVLEVKPMRAVPQWEYWVTDASNFQELTGIANSLGASSWELVSVVRDSSNARPWVGFFKRLRRGGN
ncbi:MAG: hypothetical protein LAP21_03390 [Acidobacteriia bacterium]|nr:hypothetical protein [Terriglobia bacterium]